MDNLTLQVYVKDSNKAVGFYQKAFDAELQNIHKNDDGTFAHVELSFYGFEIAVSESWFKEVTKGNTMQFIFKFGKDNEAAVKKAYEVLKEEAKIVHDLGFIGWSPLAFAVMDKFGVSWCIAV